MYFLLWCTKKRDGILKFCVLCWWHYESNNQSTNQPISAHVCSSYPCLPEVVVDAVEDVVVEVAGVGEVVVSQLASSSPLLQSSIPSHTQLLLIHQSLSQTNPSHAESEQKIPMGEKIESTVYGCTLKVISLGIDILGFVKKKFNLNLSLWNISIPSEYLPNEFFSNTPATYVHG